MYKNPKDGKIIKVLKEVGIQYLVFYRIVGCGGKLESSPRVQVRRMI